MFTDARTWTTMLYMVLMLPLGIVYFTVTITFLAVSIAFIGAPLAWTFGDFDHGLATINWGYGSHVPTLGDALVLLVAGVLLLFATLHLVRALGRMHGLIAKSLLVSRTAN